MDKIENGQVERVLRDDELDTVNGGFGLVAHFTSPAVICDPTAAISVRVSAFTVTVWFATKPAAEVAAAVLTTSRQRKVAAGKRFGWNRK